MNGDRLRPFRKIFATSVVVLVLLVISNSATIGASPDEIKLTTPFPRVEISAGYEIQLEININNLGTQYETLSLVILKPENWEATLRSGGYVIKMVSLAPRENRSVELMVSPPLEENFGSHTIEIKALDERGNVRDSLEIILDSAEVSTLGILLSTPNPSIEGPAGEDFKFTVDVGNETGEERDIVLSSVHPTNWNVTFMPIYELTLVRAIHMKAGDRKLLEVTVSPPLDVEAGEYQVVMKVTSGIYEQSLDLGTVITGTYKFDLFTLGGLLNLSAQQGERAPVSMIVINEGSAPLASMSFASNKPSGWEVVFEPSEIPLLPPGASREVSVGIKPSADAIPGDYSITLRAFTGSPHVTSDKLELRVTVLGSIMWGLFGVLIIVLVIAGLLVIFWRLGRR